ncbi:MAG: hypothetical protein K8R77_04875 [Anaerolineaceae bacterium]|nr:hypothetical protein [Anaerolineaceae bacterium]
MRLAFDWMGQRQGRAAAYAMTGKDFSVDHIPFFNVSNIYIERYTYIGEPHGEDGEVFIWKTESAYRKVRIVGGKLAGVLLLGNRHGTMAMYWRVRNLCCIPGQNLLRLTLPGMNSRARIGIIFFIKSFILQGIPE